MRDNDEDVKSVAKVPTPNYKRTNTGNMYEDLMKDLNNNSKEDLTALTFDFISEDEDEDVLGDESKNFIKNFDLTIKE